VLDFFDQMKSRTPGIRKSRLRARGYRVSNLAKVDVLLNSVPVDAFSAIVHRAKPTCNGRKMTSKLRELIPRQLFDVPIQAAIGGRIIARETVKAKRKDVLASATAGDITASASCSSARKRQEAMKQIVESEVPQEASWPRSASRSTFGGRGIAGGVEMSNPARAHRARLTLDSSHSWRLWPVSFVVGRASSDDSTSRVPTRGNLSRVSVPAPPRHSRRQRRRDRREPPRSGRSIPRREPSSRANSCRPQRRTQYPDGRLRAPPPA